MLTRIPRYRYTEEGTVREYLDSRCADSFASAAPTMFYPVYPATEIDRFDPEPFKAFAATAAKKYAAAQDDQSALTLGQYAALFARLNDGEAALDVITEMVRAMMMNNLVTAASDWRGHGHRRAYPVGKLYDRGQSGHHQRDAGDAAPFFARQYLAAARSARGVRERGGERTADARRR